MYQYKLTIKAIRPPTGRNIEREIIHNIDSRSSLVCKVHVAQSNLTVNNLGRLLTSLGVPPHPRALAPPSPGLPFHHGA